MRIPVDRIIEEIRKKKAKRVLIQVPEGLKMSLSKIYPIIVRKTGSDVIIHGETCFGPCDLALGDLNKLGCDLLIHLAHTPIKKPGKRVVFIDVFDDVPMSKSLLEKIIKVCKGKKVGLAASIQYLQLLKYVKKIFTEKKIDVRLGNPKNKYFSKGQISGCDVSSVKDIEKEVDLFIVIGGGLFHGLGVSLKTHKRTFLADPYKGDLIDLDSITRRKLALIADRIEKARNCRKFGVIIGLKEGQTSMKLVDYVRSRLKGDVLILAMSDLKPEKLAYYPWIDAFIQTLCPRISVDDLESYERPVLSVEQFEVMIGERRFEDVYPSVRRL
ncbi:diphthamide biosynthesis enzyme Dph2 [Candidatus Geothermarchaeota archaeon]|nr:MAG: diphthamide biosynthesis enzyme Dph2 [Candidatus Geothermarchaeota archaeon]